MNGYDDLLNSAIDQRIAGAIEGSRAGRLRGLTQTPGVQNIDPGEADEATGLRGMADAMAKEEEEEQQKQQGGGGMDPSAIAGMVGNFMG